MNGLKEWLIKCGKDKEFAKKFKGKGANEVAMLAEQEGFNFTPEEFMDLKLESVSGGKTTIGKKEQRKLIAALVDASFELKEKGADWEAILRGLHNTIGAVLPEEE